MNRPPSDGRSSGRSPSGRSAPGRQPARQPARPLARRLREWRKSRADERLFRHLCEMFRLEERDTELLVELADQHQLVRLSEIFVRPGLFRGSPAGQRFSERDVERLGRRIFDSAPDPGR